MYRNESHTPKFPEFGLPFAGHLNPNNRWIKKAEIIPWDLVEQEYKNHLSGSSNGSPAAKARMAFAALVIKEELGLSDRETVAQISENPYLQFFAGLEEFEDKEPFDASMMVHFRARFPAESMSRINEAIALKALQSQEVFSRETDDSDSDDRGNPTSPSTQNEKENAKEKEPENQGKLLIDASCTPADIRYPTDLSLLNEAREKTEQIIDRMHKERPRGSKKPRTYRRKARKEFVAMIKKKNKSANQMRKAIRKQLGYVKRNLGHIQALSQTVSLSVLKPSWYRTLLVIHELYRQQKIMYDLKQKRVDDRIVSIWFPHVRPIKRGKAHAETEFGAKINLSVVKGFSFLERVSWNNFNEGTELILTIEEYRRRFGFYPESVHVDKIYRTRKNIVFCNDNGIRIAGPRLGRPPKDESLNKAQKKQARQDEIDRIPIEGKLGQGKRRFGWGRIMAKLTSTSETVIALNLLVMNLVKIAQLGNFPGLFWLVCLVSTRMTRTWGNVFSVFQTEPTNFHPISFGWAKEQNCVRLK